MIVVAGGSGTLGRLLVTRLQTAGQTVRVLVKDASKARKALGADVDVVAADVRHPASLPAALRDAEIVISAVHGFLGGRGAGPAEVDRDGNAHLVNAAAQAGAAVVLTSVVGAAANSPLDLFRMKYAAEQQLRASGVPWTLVRGTPFLETWIAVLQHTAARSGRPLVFGQGRQPIAFVSARDVAAVLAAATQARLRNQVLEVCGPERLTMTQLALAVQAASADSAAPRHLPRPLLRLLATAAAPASPQFARQNRAAMLMDTAELTSGARPLHELLPGQHPTTASDLLADLKRR